MPPKTTPAPGQIYTFQYEHKECSLCVTKVTETHVYYKFIDYPADQIEYKSSWRQTMQAWNDDRARNSVNPIRTTTDPAYLHFIDHAINTPEKGL